jgi:hypothetical protein
MISVSEIRMRLVALLAGELSFDAFDEWLTASSWNMHLDSSQDAQSLVGAIELAFAEHNLGHISDSELVARLQAQADAMADSFSLVHTGVVVTHQRKSAHWYLAGSEQPLVLSPVGCS